ncbi:hypothetical protein D3C76_961870 [compost metagenome]
MAVVLDAAIGSDRRTRGDVPAAFLGRYILDCVTKRLLSCDYGMHSSPLDTRAGLRIRTEGSIPLALSQQARRNHQGSANHHWRGRADLLHGLQLTGSLLQSGSQLLISTTRILRLHTRLLASGHVVTELEIAIRPVVDFLDEALMYSRQHALCLALNAVFHFTEMLWHQLLRGML